MNAHLLYFFQNQKPYLFAYHNMGTKSYTYPRFTQ